MVVGEPKPLTLHQVGSASKSGTAQAAGGAGAEGDGGMVVMVMGEGGAPQVVGEEWLRACWYHPQTHDP